MEDAERRLVELKGMADGGKSRRADLEKILQVTPTTDPQQCPFLFMASYLRAFCQPASSLLLLPLTFLWN